MHWSSPDYINAEGEVKWGLTDDGGLPLGVGRNGKEYKVNVFLKKSTTLSIADNDVFYKSKTLNILWIIASKDNKQ